jgi:hypothetical protein
LSLLHVFQTGPGTHLASYPVLRVEKALLAICFSLVSCLAYSSTLKKKAVHSNEMMMGICRTIQLYILKIIYFVITSLRTSKFSTEYLYI